MAGISAGRAAVMTDAPAFVRYRAELARCPGSGSTRSSRSPASGRSGSAGRRTPGSRARPVPLARVWVQSSLGNQMSHRYKVGDFVSLLGSVYEVLTLHADAYVLQLRGFRGEEIADGASLSFPLHRQTE